MSPRRCIVNGCTSVSGQDEHRNVTFHTFPLNLATRKVWMENCKLSKTKNITKSILVCSRHFRRVDFQPLKNNKYLLNQGAVPTIFPWGKETEDVATSSGARAEPSSKSIGPVSKTTEEQPKVLSSIKAEKLSALKQRSASADEYHATTSAAEDKSVPRKSLDSASAIKKAKPASIDTAPLSDGELTKRKLDFVSTLAQGMKLEAQDFNGVWHHAKIMEVDPNEKEVLVHFEKDTKGKGPAIIDEWISMNSSRLRPIEKDKTAEPAFKAGDRCLARWTDSRKFPATVQRVVENNLYEVLFDDGLTKIVKGTHMNKYRRPGTPVSTPQPTPVVETPPTSVTVPTPPTSAKGAKKPLKIHPIPKFDLTKLNMPEIPLDGEWCCQWVNDTPIGREGYLHNADGNKRPTVLVDDWRLPKDWTKHLYQRSSVSGKWDVVLVGPTNKRFRSKNDVKVYLEEHGLVYNPDVYDFSIHKRRAKDLGVYVYTDDYVPPAVPKPSLNYSNFDIKTPLDTTLENKQEPFPGFAPIDSVSLPPSLNTSLNLDASVSSVAYALEEGYTYVGALKVEFKDNLYYCPKEGCNKTFRKENHLQIHIKHYHGELSKQLGACPNMTELAYFRTKGTTVDDATVRAQAPSTPATEKVYSADKASRSNRGSPVITIKQEVKEEPSQSISVPEPRAVESQSLKRKPDTDSKLDEPKEKKPALAGDIPSAKLTSPPQSKFLTPALPSTSTIVDPPERKAPAMTVSGLRAPPRPKFRIRKPPKKSSGRRGNPNFGRFKKLKQMFKERNIGLVQSQQSFNDSGTGNSGLQSSADGIQRTQRLKYFQHQSTERPVVGGAYLDPSVNPQRYINENGEMIKIVRMRQEEIINCLCTFGEEDGLMIQCELCLCWQHGACNGIDKESQVPDKYICFICKNPTLGRKSLKYIHDQEWLYEGRLFHSNFHLPSKNSAQRFDVLKQSHTLLGNMLELKKSLHSLNVKINIAANKDHPKMYLWSKPWDDQPANNHRNISSEMGQDQVVPKSEQGNQIDSKSNRVVDQRNDNASGILNNILSMSDGKSTSNNQDVQKNSPLDNIQVIRPNIPEPEAAIDSLDCQRRLLEHIQKQQNLIMSRMQMIDAQIIALEAMDENSNIYPDPNNSRTTSTIHMLLNNLNKLSKLYLINQTAAANVQQAAQ